MIPDLGNLISCRLHIMSIRHVGLACDDARERLSTLISASEMWLCWWSGGDDGIDGGRHTEPVAIVLLHVL